MRRGRFSPGTHSEGRALRLKRDGDQQRRERNPAERRLAELWKTRDEEETGQDR
jgi:hypothetical protein